MLLVKWDSCWLLLYEYFTTSVDHKLKTWLLFALALLISLKKGSHVNFFIDFHFSVHLTGFLLLIRLIFLEVTFGTLFIRLDSSLFSTARVAEPKVTAVFLLKTRRTLHQPVCFSYFKSVMILSLCSYLL